jgi:hypothetical protein
VDLHVGDQIHADVKMVYRIREHGARQVIAVRVLLPVEEKAVGLDLERVAQNRGAAVRRGPKPNDLRAHLDAAVVVVGRLVGQGDMQGHGDPSFIGLSGGEV